jgi:drug/metabolite transporter (DMT)-like permease
MTEPRGVHRHGGPHRPCPEDRDPRHGQTIIGGVTRRHLALLVIGVTAVSFSAVFVRLAGDTPPLAIAFYRCAMASIVLVPIALVRHRRPLRALSRRDRSLLVASGVILAAHFASWIPAISMTSVAASAVLVQTSPVWVAVLGRFVGEPAARGTAAGIALALGGVVVIALQGPGGGGTDPLLGDLLALAGAFFAAIYILLGRRLRPVLPLVAYTAVVYSVSATTLAAAMAATATPFTGYPPTVWVLFVAITVGPQFLGHTVFNYLLGHVRASIVSISLLAEPVGATLLAFVFLDEAPGAWTVAGGALVLAGVYLAIRAETRTAREVLDAPLE